MLFHKHLLSLLGLASLAAAAESSNDDEQHAHWHPSYKRKAVNAHFNTSSTEHHFNDYTGYQDYQDLILRHRSGSSSVKQHKRHSKHKHIFHGKHKKMTLSHQAKDGAVAGLTSDVKEVKNNVASNSPTNSAAGSASVDKSLKETTPRRSSSGSQYKLIKEYSGSSFFDDMDFYSEDDPSHGMVDYVDKRTAQQAGLIGTKNGNAMMKIGYGNGDGVQKAVRVSTKMTFTGGIMLLDAYHMPTGCGIWPAFWSMPKNPSGGWPHGGEIDLIEGVHYFNRNMMSIHAPSWCTVEGEAIEMLGELAMPDKNLAKNCNPHITDDQGCGVKSTEDGDYGQAYNRAGGGIHALYWDSDKGIHAYFFPRNRIPSDITEDRPDPSSWGIPKASWPATHCKPDDYFYQHAAVFTNTVCGTWAGSSDVWNNPMGGQSFTCREKTGQPSCWSYMKSGHVDLSTAYWEIKSLKIFQTSRRE